jgi:hypothetical protein
MIDVKLDRSASVTFTSPEGRGRIASSMRSG